MPKTKVTSVRVDPLADDALIQAETSLQRVLDDYLDTNYDSRDWTLKTTLRLRYAFNGESYFYCTNFEDVYIEFKRALDILGIEYDESEMYNQSFFWMSNRDINAALRILAFKDKQNLIK